MKLTIKYFGMIAEVVGQDEEIIEFTEAITVDNLNTQLQNKYSSISSKNYQIAVNQDISLGDFIITEDAEIALLPPFAGGWLYVKQGRT